MVTGRKVISFLSIFGSQFLSHQKISVSTKDTAELNVKHVKYNVKHVKTQRNYHKIDQNSARKSLHVQVRVAIIVTMVTIKPFVFCPICTWSVMQTFIATRIVNLWLLAHVHFFHSHFCKKVIVKGYEWTFLQKNVDFGDCDRWV